MQQAESIPKEREVQYVPDVYCPGCGYHIQLEKRTYSFYNGAIRCRACQGLFRVRTGDRVYIVGEHEGKVQPTGESFLSDTPFPGSEGGILLEPPVLLEPGGVIPTVFLRGIRSEHIPEEPRHHMETAVRSYQNGQYDAVAVPCRAAIQAALRHYGIPDGPVGQMVEHAVEQGMLKGFVGHCCGMVIRAGGDAAHSTEGPQTQGEALAVIGATVTVLGRLYAPGSFSYCTNLRFSLSPNPPKDGV